MAIIFEGSTTCAICSRKLDNTESYDGFPPFVINIKDPMAIFNDAGVHTACFIAHPLREETSVYLEMALRAIRDKRCFISGEPIPDYDRDIALGLFTRDQTHPLYPYNFVHMDKASLSAWEGLSEFRHQLETLQLDPSWDDGWNGRYLSDILRTL